MVTKIEIKVKGQINKEWQDWFEGLEINCFDDYTLLYGEVKDQAFLHGILNKIRDLNLKLISVNPTN